MKNIITLLCILLTTGLYAQNLRQYIPKDALIVAEISGDQMLDLVSLTDIETMFTSDDMREAGASFDLKQFGFNPDAKAYYYNQKVSDIGYQCALVEIADLTQAEQMISSQLPEPPVEKDGYKLSIMGPMAAAWNQSYATLCMAEVPKQLLTMDDLISEYYEQLLIEEQAQEEDIDLEEEAVEEEVTEGEYDDYYYPEEENPEPTEFDLMLRNMSAPPLYTDEEMKDFISKYMSSSRKLSPAQSIQSVHSYTSGRNKNASVYLWVNNFKELLGESMNSMLPTEMLMGAKPGEMIYMDALTSNLVFGEDDIQVLTSLKLSPSIVPTMKKMYGSSIDKSFLNYFNQDDLLGYMSISTDTKKALEAYPELGKVLYGPMFPNFKEEIEIGTDLISVFLDEEEISKLITGDMLFMLHNLEEREVTFTTYDYDDDFNAVEVEKTEMQRIPVFSVMVGSENRKIVNKLFQLGIKYGVAEKSGRFYSMMADKTGGPFDVFMTMQNDIIFITNSPKKMRSYSLGKNIKNLGKHKSLLKDNVMSLYMSNEKSYDAMMKYFPMLTESGKDLSKNFPEMYITMGEMEDDTINYDLVVKKNNSPQNSLKLLLNSIKNMMDQMKEAQTERL